MQMTSIASRLPLFQGTMTALVTPFKCGSVDWACLDRLVDRQIECGIEWLVPCGTTGEAPTLSETERRRVAEAVISQADSRCRVLVGTGTNCTQRTIDQTRCAADAGADAALIVAPYYNRPTQEGLFLHFSAVAEAVDLPIVLYNVPPRTSVNIGNDVVVRLFEQFENVVAIKHATGSVDGVSDLRLRSGIAILSGDDALTFALMSLGGVGVISVISNLVPKLVKSLTDALLAGDQSLAAGVRSTFESLAIKLGRFGPNPLPIKTAMAACDLLVEEFRLPLCPLGERSRVAIVEVLHQHGLLPVASEGVTA